MSNHHTQIETSITSKLNEIFNDKIKDVVSESIEKEIQYYKEHFEKIDEAKDKFYNELSEAKDNDYPEPIDYNGPFKFCGVCWNCNKRNIVKGCNSLPEYNMEEYDRLYNKYLTDGVNVEYDSKGKQLDHGSKLLDGEYGLLCTIQEERSNNQVPYSGKMITNFGNIITFWKGGSKLQCNVINPNNNSWQYYIDSATVNGGQPTPPVYHSITMKLSKEYCEILGCMDLLLTHNSCGSYSSTYDIRTICRITDIYKKYHPKASEICKIEMKQKEIQKSIIELQTQETNIANYKSDLDKLQTTINEQNETLQKEKQIHRDKLKNLFQREKSVQMKESLHSCKEELKDIALQLNDMYILTDSPDENIQYKLNEILGKLNTLYAEPVCQTVIAQAL